MNQIAVGKVIMQLALIKQAMGLKMNQFLYFYILNKTTVTKKIKEINDHYKIQNKK